MYNLTKRLKEIRLENNLTQTQVAKKLKITSVAYNRYENGVRTIPLEFLCELADIYDVSLDYLVGRRDY